MVCKLKYNTMKWMCRERKKKPACLVVVKQAGVNAARQMCRELNRQIELSGHRDREGETGKSGNSGPLTLIRKIRVRYT